MCAGALSGCAGTPPPLPPSDAPPAYREARAAADPAAAGTPIPPMPADGRWWRAFGDPALDALIDRADAGSPTVQAVLARLAEARAAAATVASDRGLKVGARAGLSRQGGPLVNAAGGEGTLALLAADLSFDVDLFGRLARRADAARLDVQAADARARAVRLAVQTQVARTYAALRGLDAEIAAVDDALRALRQATEVQQRRFAIGSIAEIELLRSRAELGTSDGERHPLERRRRQLEHLLATLVGAAPSDLTLPARAAVPSTVTVPAIPAGVPSAMLLRRADVAASRAALAAAQARVGVAQDAWLPVLPLTASGGAASSQLGELLAVPSRFWSIGALVALPLIDGGRRDAAVQAARASFDAAAAAHREQVLAALREVDDELAALRTLADEAAAVDAALAAASRAETIARERFERGLGSQLEWIDARRVAQRERRAAGRLQTARVDATIALVRALGGGW